MAVDRETKKQGLPYNYISRAACPINILLGIKMKLSTLIRKVPFELRPILISMVIIIFSIFWSLSENDWVHLERSGHC